MDLEEDSDWIEAEIQKQLEALASSEDVLSWQYEAITSPNEDIEESLEDEDGQIQGNDMPDSVQNYLHIVNRRSDVLQKDLEECQLLLSDGGQVVRDSDFYTQSTEMKEIAFILGEDPEELRDRVLAEVEEEDRKETEQTSDQRINDEIDTVTADEDYTISSETTTLEKVAFYKLLQLDEKLKQRHADIQEDIQHQTTQQVMLREYKEQERWKKQQQYDDELKQMKEDRQIYLAKAEEELEVEQKKKQGILNEYQARIKNLSKQTEQERLEFESNIKAQREEKMRQRQYAARLIQAVYRSHRVRKKYHCRLNRLKEERQQRKFQERQMEIVALRRVEEQRKKKEKAEKKQKEEEERMKKEEREKQAQEERKKKGAKEKERIAQERRSKELLEKERLAEENRLHEANLKQAKELEERTQEILSKIARDNTNNTVIQQQNDRDARKPDDVKPKTQDVFLTASTDMIPNTTSMLQEPNIQMNSVIPGSPAETSSPCKEMSNHSCRSNVKEMTKFECIADQQERNRPCVLEVSQQVQFESINVNNNENNKTLKNDTPGVNKEVMTHDGRPVNGYTCANNGKLSARETAHIQMDTSETVPVHRDTLQTAPVHGDASQTAPVHRDTSQTAPVHRDTLQTAPVHRDASQTAPVHRDISQTAPVHRDTSQTAHIHMDTSETVPVHRDTLQTAPVHRDASQTAPVHRDTSQTTPVHKDTSQTTPEHRDTSQTTSVHRDTSQIAPVHRDTSQTAPVHRDTSQTTPVHKDTSQTTPVHRDASQTTPVHKDTSQIAPVHRDTSQIAPLHKDTSQTASVHRDTSQTTPVHRDTSQTTPVHSDTSQTAPVHRDTSQTAHVHRDISQTAPVHRDISQTAPVHRDTSQTAPVHRDTSQTATVHRDILQTTPVHIDARRLQWLHNCPTHSSLVCNMMCNETRKALRRVRGDKKLPALTSSQLLAASQPQTQVSEVNVVIVEEAAACSLSSLRSCHHLQCLHIQRSGVTLLAGIDKCQDISYINLQDNRIEGVDCRDRTELTQLILQNNKLTSIHGLEGCTQLRYVQLSQNCITRTGGLQSLMSITHLDISHNQLVSTDGLGHLVHLQDLNVSHNHLSTIQEIETCCLLQRLNIESNSLVEMPPVQNHVVLREISLTDNSLTSISPLGEAWLPLLQYLSLAQNGLSELPDMEYCIMLKSLDVSQNCITEIDVITSRLKKCYYLEELSLEGNPVALEDNYRYNVLGGLIQLQILDDQAVKHSPWDMPSVDTLSAMCLSQLHSQDKLHSSYQQYIKSLQGNSSENILEASQVKSTYLECNLKQVMQQRCMHESGELTLQKNIHECLEETFYKNIEAKDTKWHGHHNMINNTHPASSRQDPTDDHTHPASMRISGSDTSVAALVKGDSRVIEIQPHQDISRKKEEARQDGCHDMAQQDVRVQPRQYVAAVCIQALWRGYRVRKMLAIARKAVRYHDSDEEEDAMMYGEIDPTAWDMPQASLDDDWTPSATPVIPMQHARIPPSNQCHQTTVQHSPQPARPAWYESSITETRHTPRDVHSPIGLSSKPPIPPVYTSPGTDTPRTAKTHRQDQLSEEWGFKDSTTAELMMKRAKKLTKGGNKKKALDPLERYHHMKKAQGSARVVPSPKKGIQRQEFFQAREQEAQKVVTAQRKEKEQQEARTFQWVQQHADSSCDNMSDSDRHSHSEPNLPAMSHHALQGRVQLTASPSLELQSVDGASSISSMSQRPRSHSLSSQRGHDEVRLPAIKTNSAPSGRGRDRQAGGSKKAIQGRTITNYIPM